MAKKTTTPKAPKQSAKQAEIVPSKSVGQTLVEQVRDFLEQFVTFPETGQATVAATWIVGSWLVDAMHVWPYLVISADTRGAGKTTLLQAVSMLSPAPIHATACTLAFLLAKHSKGGQPDGFADATTGYQPTTPIGTMIVDEGESIPREMQRFLRTGYKRGDTYGKTTTKGDTVEVQSFGPRAIALIGTLEPTLYSRTILIRLRRVAAPPKDLITWLEEPTAEAIRQQCQHLRETMLKERANGKRIDLFAPDARMVARSRELWASVFGVARFLNLDAATFAGLVEQADRIETAKDAQGEVRQKVSADKERQALHDMRAYRVLRDAAEVSGELGQVSSAGLLERLKKVTLGGWGNLTPEELSGLLGRYGLRPAVKRAQDLPRVAEIEKIPTAHNAEGVAVKFREQTKNRHPLARCYDGVALRAAWQNANATGQGAYLESVAAKAEGNTGE